MNTTIPASPKNRLGLNFARGAEGAESTQSTEATNQAGSQPPRPELMLGDLTLARKEPRLILMVDIETMSTSRNAVIHQAAFIGVDPRNMNEVVTHDAFNLPVQPQIESGRHVSYKWLQWMFGGKHVDQRAVTRFLTSHDGDSDELVALVRGFVRKIKRAIESADGQVELWARGTDFDFPNLQGLIEACGETVPWTYDSVCDLRTVMRQLGLKKDQIDSHDIVQHIALEDCRYQLRQLDAVRAIMDAAGI